MLRVTKSALLLLVCTLLICTLRAVPAQAEITPLKFSGDLRAGYFNNERTSRTDVDTETDDWRARLRLALDTSLSAQWRFRTRAAGRFSTEQERSDIYLRTYPTGSGGASMGDVTLDELYVHYQAQRWSLRLGRMQTALTLRGVAAKSLDLDDSSNTEINWTDGVHVQYSLPQGWRSHLILQHRDAKGSSSVARAPLDFSDSGSRVSLFAGLDNSQPGGVLSQLSLGLALLPDALATQGVANARRDHYLTFTSKLAATWTLDEQGRRLVLGAELGYAPRTPRNTVTNSGDWGDANGLAWQLAANLYELLPRTHAALVYGEAGAGWLLSPGFRNNDRLLELRVQHRFTDSWSAEARYRIREELDLPAAALQAREDRDYYFRLTGRF